MVLSGSALAGGSGDSGRVRQAEDFYSTSPNDTHKFMLQLQKDGINLGQSILEPAIGNKAMSDVIQEYYPLAKMYGMDIVQRVPDYKDVDFKLGSFLDLDTTTLHVDSSITNPPFKLAKEFINQMLKVSDKYAIVLLKLSFLEGASRQKWFKEAPLKYVYVSSKRVNTWRNGNPLDEKGKPWASGTMAFAWFVFEKGYDQEPIIRWV